MTRRTVPDGRWLGVAFGLVAAAAAVQIVGAVGLVVGWWR